MSYSPPISQHNDKTKYSPAFIAIGFLLTIAILFGGGGSRFPATEIFIQLAALPALFIGVRNLNIANLSRDEKFIGLLLIASLALIMLQIIPLPPFIWQSLPGRDLLVDLANVIGRDNAWYSLSIDPSMTIDSGLSIVIFAAIILAGYHINTSERIKLFKLVLGLAGVHLFVALMQMASGGENFYFYATSHKGLPVGLFANRNHMGTLMILSIMVCAALYHYQRAEPRNNGIKKSDISMAMIIYSSAAALFTLGVLITNSRTATVLLFIAFLVILFLAIPKKHSRLAMPFTIGGAIIIGGGALLLYYTNRFEVLNKLLERFEQNDDQRFEFWPNIWQALQNYMPFGSGLGTFDIGFRANEDLEIVGSHFVNNAHNEYLELALETGVFGPLITIVALLWLLRKILRLIKDRFNMESQDLTALYLSIGVGLIALHSLTDYPMRRFTILAICAFFVSSITHKRKSIG